MESTHEIEGAHRVVDCPTCGEETLARRNLVEYHRKNLEDALEAKFLDGSSVVEYILATNKDLAARLSRALFGSR